MPKVRTINRPDDTIEVGEQEALDLRRMGQLVEDDKPAEESAAKTPKTSGPKAGDTPSGAEG